MSSVDWGQEFTQLRSDAEELAAAGMGEEAGIRAVSGMFARMLVRTGAWAPEDSGEVEAVLAGLEGNIVGYEIGPPVIQNGSCYLHPIAWIGKDNTRTPAERNAIMLGAVETPIIVTLDVAPGQQRAPADPHEVGWLGVATSELTDVARQLRRIVIRSRTRVEYDREWQQAHPDYAAEREGVIAISDVRIAACEAGLRELAAEYGAMLATPEANLSADEREREAGEVRRSIALMSDLQDYVRAQQSLASAPKAESDESAY